jgi:hypothetical protein
MLVREYSEGISLEGYISGMPESVYHNTEGFTSKSSLAKLDQETPFRFFNGRRKGPTPAMRMGTALHCAVLEREKFEKEYLLLPEVKTKTLKAYKEAVKENPGKEILNGTEAYNLTGMLNALSKHERASELLALPGWFEVSGFHVDEGTGVKLRHRFDKLTKCGIGIDLKKTQSVKIEEISKTINSFRYDMQDALYSDAYEIITGQPLKQFYFIFVEETYPHQVAVVYLDDISRDVGRNDYQRLIIDYSYYKENMNLVNNNSDEEMVSLPEYVLRNYEQELEDGGIF